MQFYPKPFPKENLYLFLKKNNIRNILKDAIDGNDQNFNFNLTYITMLIKIEYKC